MPPGQFSLWVGGSIISVIQVVLYLTLASIVSWWKGMRKARRRRQQNTPNTNESTVEAPTVIVRCDGDMEIPKTDLVSPGKDRKMNSPALNGDKDQRKHQNGVVPHNATEVTEPRVHISFKQNFISFRKPPYYARGTRQSAIRRCGALVINLRRTMYTGTR